MVSTVLLAIFLVLLVLITIAILVTAFYHLVLLGVPFVPTPRAACEKMVDLAQLQEQSIVVDLGAGTGTILREAKRRYPGITAVGYELAPTVWLYGWLRSCVTHDGIQLLRRDALTADVQHADAVFLYMTPPLMAKLEEKFDRELRPGTIVLSHGFAFPRRQPVEEIAMPWGRKRTRVLRYVW